MTKTQDSITSTHTHSPQKDRPKAYAFKNWGTLFENAQSRKQRKLSQVLLPQFLGTKQYHAIINREYGFNSYTIYMLLAQVAAECPQRGLLANTDGPLTLDQLSIKTRMPTEYLERALKTLMDPEIACIEEIDCPKHLIVSGSMRRGRNGKPAQPEVLEIRGLPQEAPDFHVEWTRVMAKREVNGETELYCKRVLPQEVEAILNPQPPAPPKKSKTLQLLEEALTRIQKLEQMVVDHISQNNQPSNPQQDTGYAGCVLPQKDPAQAPTEKRVLPQQPPPQSPAKNVVDHTQNSSPTGKDPAQIIHDAWNTEKGLHPARPLRAKDRRRIEETLNTSPEALDRCLKTIAHYGLRARSGHSVPGFKSFLEKRLQAIKRDCSRSTRNLA